MGNLREELQVVNETVVLEISRDRMLGVIEFQEPLNGGKVLSVHDIKKELQKKGIVSGILEDVIAELVKSKKYRYKYIIAKGEQAEDGKDGVLKLNFDKEEIKHLRPKEKEDGTVDFRELSAVRNVKTGDLLATKTMATMGKNGFNVLGQTIKAKKGKEARLPKGKNTHASEDGLSLYASVDGKLEYDGHNVYVNTVYTLNGDLDSGTGNIDFLGNVIITGSVKSGFTIKAVGSVEVKGSVEEATIMAGGDIFLSYGIQGGNKGKLVAGGNIIAKFIQNTTVEAGGDVITEAIMHSNVSAGNMIKVESGKGLIVGGSVSATSLILARNIGSPMGTVTCVQIGVPPSTYEKFKALEKQIAEENSNLRKIEKSIQFLCLKSQASLDPQKQAMLRKLLDAQGPLKETVEALQHEYRELANTLRDVQDGMIKISDTIHPGVKVTIGSTIKYIDDSQVHCTIRRTEGEIVIGS
ncbi:hypothetical protein CS063_13630 [Sporanaerobium hydrogeniformans]|uniref:Uncharacterized protein n=1 Tax=Sporanaerobium hydrogeniformans TaxID=3072179 RepID=A0AC61DA04_9FIRM|nr:FapA family protein [Sporanaerobium hydrogeniformans]PHV69873.1 hypothetical protein CS063_13630 [Sporanaerobium hydrogeniformans]